PRRARGGRDVVDGHLIRRPGAEQAERGGDQFLAPLVDAEPAPAPPPTPSRRGGGGAFIGHLNVHRSVHCRWGAAPVRRWFPTSAGALGPPGQGSRGAPGPNQGEAMPPWLPGNVVNCDNTGPNPPLTAVRFSLLRPFGALPMHHGL